VRITCSDEAKFRIVNEVTHRLAEQHEVITIDGVRAVFEDGWGLLRASNTQPVLVLRFESQTVEGLERIRSVFRDLLGAYPEVVWDA
jgi:phosphomannomutase/phosphoglucomutase